MGISQGSLPLIGYNYGSRKLDRVGEVFMKAMKASFAWGLLCALIVLFFPVQILSVFNSEPEFLEQGVLAMRLFAIVYLTMGTRQNVGSFFQGIGKGLPSLIIGLAREFIFILPLVYMLSALIGRTGVWLTFPISDVLGAILALVWILVEARRMGLQFHLIYPKPSASIENGETND